MLLPGLWLADHWLTDMKVGAKAWPMAAAMFAYQLQDWARRCFFAQRRTRPVLLSDLVAYGGQVLLVAGFGAAGLLTINVAFACVAFCYALGFAISLAQLRFGPSLPAARALSRSMWRTSRDYLLSAQLQWLGTSGVLFIGAGGLCLLAISYMGSELLVLAYGPAYAAFGHLVALQCAYVFLSFVARFLTFNRRRLDQVQVVLLASLASAIVSLAGVAVLSRPWPETGLLVGMLSGLGASLLVLWRWPGPRDEPGR